MPPHAYGARGLAEPDDVALDAILELERRWTAGARTLVDLGFPLAEVALAMSGSRRYGSLYWDRGADRAASSRR
jgi:hypothetical protein